MVLAVLTSQTGQTLPFVKCGWCSCKKDYEKVRLEGKHVNSVKLPVYVEREMCILKTISEYLDRTKSLRKDF